MAIMMIKRLFLTTTVLFGCVGCDQVSKNLAQTWLSDNQVHAFLGDTFRMQLAYNRGAFLSMGSSLPETWRAGLFIFAVGLLLLGLTIFLFCNKSTTTLELWAYCLLLGGGAGNLIDRVLYGYVVDFMNIGIGPLRTGIFNVADIAVTLGAMLLVAGPNVKLNKKP